MCYNKSITKRIKIEKTYIIVGNFIGCIEFA